MNAGHMLKSSCHSIAS